VRVIGQPHQPLVLHQLGDTHLRQALLSKCLAEHEPVAGVQLPSQFEPEGRVERDAGEPDDGCPEVVAYGGAHRGQEVLG